MDKMKYFAEAWFSDLENQALEEIVQYARVPMEKEQRAFLDLHPSGGPDLALEYNQEMQDKLLHEFADEKRIAIILEYVPKIIPILVRYRFSYPMFLDAEQTDEFLDLIMFYKIKVKVKYK